MAESLVNQYGPVWGRLYPRHVLRPVEFMRHREPSRVDGVEKYEIWLSQIRVGEVAIKKPSGGDFYLTRLAMEGKDAGDRQLAMAALVLAIDYAHSEERGLRTDPMGEYPDVAALWQTLVKEGIAQVVDTQPIAPPSPHAGHIRVPSPAELPLATSIG